MSKLEQTEGRGAKTVAKVECRIEESKKVLR